jgi:hypothetical protein
VEVALNLAWVVVCTVVLTVTVRALRRNALQVPPAIALTAAFSLCLVLLPVISMTDDLLLARQNALPLAAQTWHMATEGASAGLEVAALLSDCLLALLCLLPMVVVSIRPVSSERRYSAWLTRAQRLRPPPAPAL